jgi:hypothetical protein
MWYIYPPLAGGLAAPMLCSRRLVQTINPIPMAAMNNLATECFLFPELEVGPGQHAGNMESGAR